MLTSRDQIAAVVARPSKVRTVDLPGIGETAFVCMLNGREREQIERAIAAKGEAASYRALMAVSCLCDADGKRLFEQTPADLDIVNGLDWQTLHAIFQAAAEHNGMTEAAREQAEKN